MGKLVVRLKIEKKGNIIKIMEAKNQNSMVKVNAAQELQTAILTELNVTAESAGQEFTDYGKKCIMNAISGVITMCKNQSIPFDKIDQTMLKIQLQNVGYTELDFSGMPSEVYADLRKKKVKNKDGNYVETYTIAMKPQGAGNEKLVRRWGVDVKKLLTCWLVREGDEFTMGSYNGIKRVDPTWTPKSLNKKVIMVVYPVLRNDGTVEYLMADRESVIPNLVAQVRQNALYAFKKTNEKGYEYTDEKARDEFYKKVDKDFANKTLDEILNMTEYADYINPTYTSAGSREAMIIRKMQNNALKRYPKEFGSSQVKDAVENMFEDRDETVKEKAPAAKVDVADKVDFDMTATDENAPMDFSVDEMGVVEKNPQPVEKDSQPTTTNVEDTPIEDLI